MCAPQWELQLDQLWIYKELYLCWMISKQNKDYHETSLYTFISINRKQTNEIISSNLEIKWQSNNTTLSEQLPKSIVKIKYCWKCH